MTNFTTFFHHDARAIAVLLHGAPTVAVKGFSEHDLQAANWLQPGVTVVPPNIPPRALAAATARKHNQVRLAYLVGWALSMIAACVITYVFTVR